MCHFCRLRRKRNRHSLPLARTPVQYPETSTTNESTTSGSWQQQHAVDAPIIIDFSLQIRLSFARSAFPNLRYRSLLLVSLEWPNRHLLADTARQADSVVGGVHPPRLVCGTCSSPPRGPSIGTPSLRSAPSPQLHQRTAEKRLRRRHQGPLHRPSTLQGNSLGLCHGTGGHPPGGSRDRGAHLDQGTGTARREWKKQGR